MTLQGTPVLWEFLLGVYGWVWKHPLQFVVVEFPNLRLQAGVSLKRLQGVLEEAFPSQIGEGMKREPKSPIPVQFQGRIR